MIWSGFLAARAFAAKVPWQVWAAVGILLAAWIWGNHRYSAGVHVERARWEAAAAAAKARADKATVKAADKRAADTVKLKTAAKERTDAINANPANPHRGLDCERVRKAGLDASAAGC